MAPLSPVTAGPDMVKIINFFSSLYDFEIEFIIINQAFIQNQKLFKLQYSCFIFFIGKYSLNINTIFYVKKIVVAIIIQFLIIIIILTNNFIVMPVLIEITINFRQNYSANKIAYRQYIFSMYVVCYQLPKIRINS